jgi:hypothetical protein
MMEGPFQQQIGAAFIGRRGANTLLLKPAKNLLFNTRMPTMSQLFFMGEGRRPVI